MVAKRNSKKVENVVVNDVVKENEVQKMENIVVENVVENVVADVVEVAPVDVPDVDAVEVDENASAPADENGEKKQRKPRAKMDVTPLDVAGITEKRAGEIREYILQALQAENAENAETLADAYSKSVVYGVFNDIIDAMERKFIAYASRAYTNSDKWQVFANTRDVVKNACAGVADNIKNLYVCTNQKVIALRDNNIFACTGNAKYTIDNFIDNYYVFNDFNINEQIKALKENNVDVVYIPKSAYFASEVLDIFTDNGYELSGKVNIPERKFNGIDKIYPAETVWKLVKE